MNANTATVSQRGVLFFKNQSIDSDEQKILGQKLGELTGKPGSSKVSYHRHLLAMRKQAYGETAASPRVK